MGISTGMGKEARSLFNPFPRTPPASQRFDLTRLFLLLTSEQNIVYYLLICQKATPFHQMLFDQ